MPTQATQQPEAAFAEQRIKSLEDALSLDSRLQVIETAIKERLPTLKPWWRDAKTVTFLGALIAAILPVATWINNVYASSRESHRLLIQQQEEIRQRYLDRVLRVGVTPAEQEKVFGLLSRLSSDPEMQEWAKEELKKANETIKLQQELEKTRRDLISSQDKASALGEKLSKLSSDDQRALADATARSRSLLQKIEDLQLQISESIGPRVVSEGSVYDDILATVRNCSIHVTSEPSGVSVWTWEDISRTTPGADLKPVADFGGGRTPTDVSLPKGHSYQLELLNSRFRPERRVVDLTKKDFCPSEEVHVVMKHKPQGPT